MRHSRLHPLATVATTAALAFVVACLDDTLGPQAGRVRMGIAVQISEADTALSIDARVLYGRTDGTLEVVAGPARWKVSGLASSQTISVDIGDCLADPLREGGEAQDRGCPLYVELKLVEPDGLVYQTDTSGPHTAMPGAAVNVPAMTLGTGVASVSVSPTEATIVVGATLTLTADPVDGSGTHVDGRPVAWSSSDPSVVEVSPDGQVTALAVGGPVTVTAEAGRRKGTAEVTVVEVSPVESVVIEPPTVSVGIGGEVTLAATALNASDQPVSGQTIDWSSLDQGIATVTQSGVVHGVSAGSARIVASTAGHADTATVTVIEVPSGFTKRWVGGAAENANQWENPANWAPSGVPANSDVVLISAVGNAPPTMVTADTISGLRVETGATLEVNGALTLLGPLDNDGEIRGAGYVELAGETSTLTGMLPNVRLSSGVQVIVGGAARVVGQLWIMDAAALDLNGQHLVIDRELSLNPEGGSEDAFRARLTMSRDADTLDVGGRLSVSGGINAPSLSGQLTAGVIRLSGGTDGPTGDAYVLVAGGRLVSTGTRVIINGAGEQRLYPYDANGVRLHDLEIANTGQASGGFVSFDTPTTVEGDLVVSTAAKVLINAAAVTIQGRLTTVAGSSVEGGGQLVLRGAGGVTAVSGTFSPALTVFAAPGQAVVLQPGLAYQSVTLQNGVKATLAGQTTLAGQLLISDSSSLDLSGQHLTVARELYLNPEGGDPSAFRAFVSLTRSRDTLDVGGRLQVLGGAAAPSLQGRLTAGVIRLSGGTGGSTGDAYALVADGRFVSTGTRVVFDGASEQHIYAADATGSQLRDVEIANTGGASGPVSFDTPATIAGGLTVSTPAKVLINASTVTVEGRLTTVAGSSVEGGGELVLRDPSGTGRVVGAFSPARTVLAAPGRAVTLKADLAYQSVTLREGVSVVLPGATQMTGQLLIADSSSLDLNEQQLSVARELYLNPEGGEASAQRARIILTHAADRLDVGGRLQATGGANAPSLSGQLTAGVIRLSGGTSGVTGDLYALVVDERFVSTGTRVVLAGAGEQHVYAAGAAGSQLRDVEIANTGGPGVLVSFDAPTTIAGALTVSTPVRVGIQSTMALDGRLTSVAGSSIEGGGQLVLRHASGTSGVDGTFSPGLTVFAALAQAATVKPGLGYQNVTLQNGVQVTLRGPTTFAGQLWISDSSSLDLGGQHLTVARELFLNPEGGDPSALRASFSLTRTSDTLDVGGRLQVTGGANAGTLERQLTAGVIRLSGGAKGVTGDIYALVADGRFVSAGTRLVLTGAGEQRVLAPNTSGVRLGDVEIANTDGASGAVSFDAATTINGNLELRLGRMVNPGQLITVAADVILRSGTVLENSGRIICGGTVFNEGGTITGNGIEEDNTAVSSSAP